MISDSPAIPLSLEPLDPRALVCVVDDDEAIRDCLERGESFHFSRLGDLPPEAVIDEETLRIHGTKSNATFPLIADGKVIGNATQSMKETPAGERHVFIRASTCGGLVHLHARDSGHGIPSDHLDRVFEPFHTTRPDGLGMGLAICRRVADAHGGTLKAANHESGAVFTLTLPLGYVPASSQSITTHKFV